MENEIKTQIKAVYRLADSVWATAQMATEFNAQTLQYIKQIHEQIKIVNNVLDLLNQPDYLLLNLDQTRQEMQVLGYRLYRMQDRLISLEQ
jgi:hypothetical protein